MQISRRCRILYNDLSSHSFERRNVVLSIRVPSSSCSATSRTGNSAGMILRGAEPSTSEYFEKSVTPQRRRRKSSSRSRSPFTVSAGARNISSMASAKIVYDNKKACARSGKELTGFLKSFFISGSALVLPSVAADSIACLY